MKVELLEVMGDDLMVANTARVSYGKFKEEFDDKDIRLLAYLQSHGHDSPFRHPHLQFRISCPIYVERQLFKHQIGFSANSISGRYVDFSDSYDLIENGGWRKQSKSSKQGSEGLVEDQRFCNVIQDEVVEFCKEAYDQLIEHGVSKEQARTILPLNLSTTFIWTGSLLGYLRLFRLRIKPDAQKETRDLVVDMYREIENCGKFPETFKLLDLDV